MTNSRPICFNTHIHLPPNFSTFATVDDALDQASAEGCVLLGASNYYDFSVYERFVSGARQRGIYATCGIEILCRDEEAALQGVRYNDPVNPGKVYLCGKALTKWREPSELALSILGYIRDSDEKRMAAMTDRLRDILRGGPNVDQIRADVAAKAGVAIETVVLQERHLAEAFANANLDLTNALGIETASLDSVALGNEIRNRLMKAGKPAFVEECFIPTGLATQLVYQLGGYTAYPFVVDGMNPVSEMERDLPQFMDHLRSMGITAVEFIPNRNSAEALLQYVPALWESAFAVTAGTEHNTKDRIPIAPRCKDGSPIPEPVQEIFWMSTCILAGYQEGEPFDFMKMHKLGKKAILEAAR